VILTFVINRIKFLRLIHARYQNFWRKKLKAVRIHAYGDNGLVYEDAPQPVVGENDVLVRVHASAVNPVDNAFRFGYMAAYVPLTFPATLGCDIAGVIESVGSGVKNFKVGDAVYGRTDLYRLGGFAEFVVIGASEIAVKPASLDFQQAAALPHTAVTSWRALVDIAGLQAGQKVLILGATGGIGVVAVQLAKNIGARVSGITSTANLSFLRELGADEALDYTVGSFEDHVHGMDVVLDAVGGETQERALKTLKPGGILVSLLSAPSAEAATALGIRAAMGAGTPPAGPVLKEIGALVDSGKIRPVIATVLPLAETGRALGLIAGKHTRGKIVLQVA
jgi:NADPH:quinone reductase-like Zn-dependent oxidoreductase